MFFRTFSSLRRGAAPRRARSILSCYPGLTPGAIIFRPFGAALSVAFSSMAFQEVSPRLCNAPLSSLSPAGFCVLIFCPGFGPEAVAGAMDENVFQGWLTYRHSLDFAGESLGEFGYEAMPVLDFDP
jgi:hypothetical protein